MKEAILKSSTSSNLTINPNPAITIVYNINEPTSVFFVPNLFLIFEVKGANII